MRKLIITAVLAFAAFTSGYAQFYGIDIDKLGLLVTQTTKLPKDNAMIVINSTMTALSQNPMGYRKALEFAEMHLGNPTDSLHNEELYIACLQHAAKSYVLSNSEKERPKLLLDMAQKNRIGTSATDLEFVTTDGETHHLTEPGEYYTMVYFNDPDCDACLKVKQNLENSPVIKNYVDKGLLKVIAIYPMDNQKLWKKTVYPEWIVNGWDKKQQIENESTYIMPSTMPVFYLLSPDKTVLMKNEPSLKRMERAIDKVMTSNDNDPQSLANLLFN